MVAKTYPMTTRPGVTIVPSETRLHVDHEVTSATCTCENFVNSRRPERYRDKHIAVALTQDGYIPLPNGKWVKITPEVMEILSALGK